jgi:hypothetical protein
MTIWKVKKPFLKGTVCGLNDFLLWIWVQNDLDYKLSYRLKKPKISIEQGFSWLWCEDSYASTYKAEKRLLPHLIRRHGLFDIEGKNRSDDHWSTNLGWKISSGNFHQKYIQTGTTVAMNEILDRLHFSQILKSVLNGISLFWPKTLKETSHSANTYPVLEGFTFAIEWYKMVGCSVVKHGRLFRRNRNQASLEITLFRTHLFLTLCQHQAQDDRKKPWS